MRSNPTLKSPKPLLSVEEAAVLLGETRSTLYRAIKAGDFPLPIFKIGRRFRIPRRSVELLLAGLPLTPREDFRVDPTHPSVLWRDQPDREEALAPVTPLDNIFPT